MTRLVAVLGLALILLASAAGCTDDAGAARALRQSGYTNVRLTGWDAWTCGDSDDTCTGFQAIGPSGAFVSGAVGCGLFFKGCTVRLK